MTFKNVVIIEKTEDIPLNVNHLHCGPMDIQNIEFFEDQLIKMGIPYLLAQVDTTIPCLFTKAKRYRFARGYCLFIKTYPNRED